MKLLHVAKNLAKVFVCSVLFVALTLMAETETVGGCTWTYRIIGDAAEIYNDDDVAISLEPGVVGYVAGDVVIPSVLGGKPVVGIGDRAFEDCWLIESVAIPYGITYIGDGAFEFCSYLRSITIPDSITEIGNEAFLYCSGLTNVTIGSCVTYIGQQAFEGCDSLASVNIPDSVTDIGVDAFNMCSKSLYDTTTIPGLELVDGWVIGSDYEGTTWPSGHVDLKGVRGIAQYAFSLVYGLTSVTISASVKNISMSSFADCYELMEFIVEDGNPSYKSDSGLLLTKDGRTLVEGVNGDVVIPPSVTSIREGAFEGRQGLTSVMIPNGVTNIGEYAFYNCGGLTSVTIPSSVTSIGSDAFCRCSMEEFIVEDGNPSYKSESGLLLTKDGKVLVAGVNGNAVIPNSVTSIGDSAFYGRSGLTSVTIPNGVTNIGVYAFYDCDSLAIVTIPESVTSIGDFAFLYCSGLTSVTIPNGVTNIGAYAFCRCDCLTIVTIPESVTSIGACAFEYCRRLTSVTIPGGVTSIGARAFSGCKGLTSVVFEGDAPLVEDWNDWSFEDVNPDCCVYVSRDSDGWGVDIPGVWHGLPIRYIDEIPLLSLAHTVIFDLGGHGKRSGGGREVQTIGDKGDAVAPEVRADSGWIFMGWDKSFTDVTADVTVKARWRRATHEDIWGGWSLPEGSSYMIPDSVSSLAELSHLVWRARDVYVRAGVQTEVPPSEGPIVLSLGAVTVPDSFFAEAESLETDVENGVEVWRMRIFEDADASSLVGVVGTSEFKLSDKPTYNSDLWVRTVYGSPPAWLDEEGIDRWFAMRSRKRIGWFVTLVPSSNWTAYCANQDEAAEGIKKAGNEASLSISGIEVDSMTAIHRVSVQSAEEGETWILGTESLDAPKWTYKGYSLQPSGTTSAGVYSEASNHFFTVVFSPSSTVVDGDGDGIPDVLEEKIYGTDPNRADSSGDGLTDWEKLFRYELDPFAKDTDGDGLDDEEEIMAGSNPRGPSDIGAQGAVGTSIRYYYDDDDRLVGTYFGHGAGRSRATLSPAGNNMEVQKRGE